MEFGCVDGRTKAAGVGLALAFSIMTIDPIDNGFSVWSVLRNGIRRVCPHCGRGPVLDGWLTARESCPVCGLVYERNAGDTWAFWIVGDRIPVSFAIAIVYFGFRPDGWFRGTLVFGSLLVLLVATIPQRMGLVIALHYVSRRLWPNPDDPIEPLVH